MKKTLLTLAAVVGSLGGAQGQLIITGIIDGPRSGGLPKAIEIYVMEDVADLSLWNVANYNNGGLTPTTTFSLSGTATAGTFLYVASESTGFAAYFGFAPTYTSGALNVNGDDSIALSLETTIVDVYGVIGEDGSGEPWEYSDGFAYRVSNTSPSSTFDVNDWTFSGADALDSLGTSGVNPASGPQHFPLGTYTATAVPEPHEYALAMGGLLLAVVLMRRRGARRA